MLSPSAPSESAFAASASRLVARPSAIAVSCESRPSIELAIPPTAFGRAAERRCPEDADRPEHALEGLRGWSAR